MSHFSADDAARLNKITLVACGTAWHACLVGKFMLESLAQHAG